MRCMRASDEWQMREALETLPSVAAVGVTRTSARGWTGPISGADLEGGYTWTITFFSKGRHDARLGAALDARTAGAGGDVPALVADTAGLSSTLGFSGT